MQRDAPQRESAPYICDFSRGGLDIRLNTRIQTLLRGHKYRGRLSSGGCALAGDGITISS